MARLCWGGGAGVGVGIGAGRDSGLGSGVGRVVGEVTAGLPWRLEPLVGHGRVLLCDWLLNDYCHGIVRQHTVDVVYFRGEEVSVVVVGFIGFANS